MIPMPRITITGVRQAFEAGLRDAVLRLGVHDITISVEAGGARRGASENAVIAHAQANADRDPWHLDDEEKHTVKEMVRRVVVGTGFSYADIGRFLKLSVLDHIQRQVNRGGKAFRALTPKYAERKQATYGFTRPILRATGELMDTLEVRVRRH